MRFKEYVEGAAPSVRFQPESERLQYGWGRENYVIKALERIVGTVQKAPEAKDRYGPKIDAYLTSGLSGRTASVQIKARQSGDDILFELWKDFGRKEGRDVRTGAEIYAVLDRSGSTIYLVDSSAVKQTAKQLYEKWRASADEQPKSPGWPLGQSFTGPEGEIHFQQGDGPYEVKAIAYLKPTQFLRLPPPAGFPNRVKIPPDMKAA